MSSSSIDISEGGSPSRNLDDNKSKFLRGLDPTYFPPLFQLWRGQVALLTTWAQRLDPVTTWAVTMSMALSGFFISNSQIKHEAYFIIIIFLYMLSFIETTRYQSFLMVRRRADCIQSGFFVPVLANLYDIRSNQVDQNNSDHIVLNIVKNKLTIPWERELADSLVSPESPISFVHAWTIRYKRVYMYLLTGTFMIWWLKIHLVGAYLSEVWIVVSFIVHLLITLCSFCWVNTNHDV